MRASPLRYLAVPLIIACGCSSNGGASVGNAQMGPGAGELALGGSSSGGAPGTGGATGVGGASAWPVGGATGGMGTVAGLATGGAVGTGGALGAGGALGTSQPLADTSACPEWPRTALFPFIGPWFFGNTPGPCRATILDAGRVTATYVFDYGADGRVVSNTYWPGEEGSATSELTIWGWYNGDLVSETHPDRAYVYTWEPGKVTISSAGVPTSIYHLDARGYPTELEVDYDHDGVLDTLLRHEYENCRLVSRIPVTTTIAADQQSSFPVDVEYDEAGNIVSRHQPGLPNTGMFFDYGCWQGAGSPSGT